MATSKLVPPLRLIGICANVDRCYCGNAPSSTTSLATDGRCSMPCAANSAEICGGSYGMNIYSINPVSTSSSSTLSSVTSTSSVVGSSSKPLSTTSITSTSVSSSLVSSTASSTSSATGTSSTLTAVGCYTDNTVTARTLVGGASTSGSMTLELCAANCAKFTYFGVEYGAE